MIWIAPGVIVFTFFVVLARLLSAPASVSAGRIFLTALLCAVAFPFSAAMVGLAVAILLGVITSTAPYAGAVGLAVALLAYVAALAKVLLSGKQWLWVLGIVLFGAAFAALEWVNPTLH
ncbi:hypothetical protein [Bradyrhizobium guangdongense]